MRRRVLFLAIALSGCGAYACSLAVSTSGLSGGPSDPEAGALASEAGGGGADGGADAGGGGEGGKRALPSGLLAHYKLDADGADATGHGNDAKIVDDVLFKPSGVAGSYAHCNGGSITIGPRLDMGTRSFSVSAWIRLSSTMTKPTHTLVANGPDWTNSDGTNHGYAVGYSTGSTRIVAAFADGTVWRAQAVAVKLAGDTFHHVVIVLDRTSKTVQFYVDGANALSGPIDLGNIDALGDPLSLCRWGKNRDHDMVGDLDEVMFFDSALSPASVATLRHYFGR
jgi:hypothetical protein